jgi:RNA polymerase sigma-70 factor (ECF subfamily)
MIPDAVYVQKTIEGDSESFNELVRRHHAQIYGLAYRMRSNPEDAADATQEAFWGAYKSIQSFQFQSKFSTWLYRVAINTCGQHRRKSGAREHTLTAYAERLKEGGWQSDTNAPDRRLLKAERNQLIQAALDQLPSKQRMVLTLFYRQHLKYHEIAELLNCPEGTVASRLNAAVRNLKSKLRHLQ